jgi:hypothetical protein
MVLNAFPVASQLSAEPAISGMEILAFFWESIPIPPAPTDGSGMDKLVSLRAEAIPTAPTATTGTHQCPAASIRLLRPPASLDTSGTGKAAFQSATTTTTTVWLSAVVPVTPITSVAVAAFFNVLPSPLAALATSGTVRLA